MSVSSRYCTSKKTLMCNTVADLLVGIIHNTPTDVLFGRVRGGVNSGRINRRAVDYTARSWCCAHCLFINVSCYIYKIASVSTIYSSGCDRHALDIRFIDPKTICVSDAAFHHIFYYSSSTRKQIDENIPPQPYSAQPLTTNKTSTEHDKQQLKPIKVAQQFKFSHFKEFDELLNSLESWIFNDAQEQPGPWYVSGRMWADESEPSAVSFKHGFLCSASLCRAVLLRLKTLF